MSIPFEANVRSFKEEVLDIPYEPITAVRPSKTKKDFSKKLGNAYLKFFGFFIIGCAASGITGLIISALLLLLNGITDAQFMLYLSLSLLIFLTGLILNIFCKA